MKAQPSVGVRAGTTLLRICLVLAVLYGGVIGYDLWRLNQLSDAAAQEEYNFGTEAMVGHGGEVYRSRGAYVASGSRYLIAACAVAAGALIGLTALRRRNGS